jgi:hypothetical protein
VELGTVQDSKRCGLCWASLPAVSKRNKHQGFFEAFPPKGYFAQISISPARKPFWAECLAISLAPSTGALASLISSTKHQCEWDGMSVRLHICNARVLTTAVSEGRRGCVSWNLSREVNELLD